MELAKTDLAALPESERNILTLAGARLLMATAAPHTFEAVTTVLNVPDSLLPQGERPFFVRVGKRLTENTGQPLKNKPETDDADSDTEKYPATVYRGTDL